jgi:adenylate cyclase
MLEDMSSIYRKTNPSLTYIDICNEFKINPPDKDWDGVYNFKSK